MDVFLIPINASTLEFDLLDHYEDMTLTNLKWNVTNKEQKM
jgi:hypothetical protein